MDVDNLFGHPASACATFLMLSELALHDLAKTDSERFGPQRLDAFKLLSAAVAALSEVEKACNGGGQVKVPSLRRLRTLTKTVAALPPTDANRAWCLAAEVRRIVEAFSGL